MINLKSRRGKIVAYCLVRDKQGKPKFDDIMNIPEPIWNMLTTGEKQDIKHERNALHRDP